MAVLPRGYQSFFSRIISVCAIDGREKTVLGAGGIQLQLLQICMDYATLPPFYEMSIDDIHFFYKARIKDICRLQKDV